MPLFGNNKLILLILLLCVAAHAQNHDCNARQVIVNVRDQQGKLVPGLQPSSFHASVNGRPVTILSCHPSNALPRVILMLDLSGSTNNDNHNWDLAKFVAGSLVASTSGKDHVSLVIFSDHIIDTLNFDHPTADIYGRLTNLENGRGGSSIWDSLLYSVTLFQDSSAGDAIFLISDGVDNKSKSSLEHVERELLSRGIRLFAFCLCGNVRTQEEVLGPEALTDLAHATGGSIVKWNRISSSRDRDELNTLLQNIYDQIISFYELGLELPGSVDSGHSKKLKLGFKKDEKQKSFDIISPKSLSECGQ